MFIQTESTPNPSTLKFSPGQEVTKGETYNFTNIEESKISPLANNLMKIKHVEGIFLGSDFITVTKSENISWDILKPEILTAIMEHFVAGRQVILNEGEAASNYYDENDSDIVKQIKELIETRVRPAVQQDGGDIRFYSYEGGVVMVELHGSCSGCPSSMITLKSGIENMLKYYVPEIEAVEAVETL